MPHIPNVPHSSVVGGSTAGRVLNCPGSVQALLALPPGVDVESEYAKEGTFAHEVMSNLFRFRMREEAANHPPPDLYEAAKSMLGFEFIDRELEQSHLDELIYPALDQYCALEEAYLGDLRILAVEARVAFPGIAGAFGTADLILGNAQWTIVLDWKFGAGVGVAAVYKEEQPNGLFSELVNPQLLFYTAAAVKTLPKLFTKRNLAVAIIQPRNETEPLSHTSISRQELRWFAEDLQKAVVVAMNHNAPRKKGEHCRWAACKMTCPLWTGPLLDLSALKPVTRTIDTVATSTAATTEYGDYLARAKALVDIMDMFKKEIDSQLHSFLEDGGHVPGWRLKHKVKQRQWVDERTVEKTLLDIGFEMSSVWQRKLVTFASADATAKRLGVKIPADLRVAPPSTETTIATVEDPAPVVERAIAAEAFRASLKQLQGKQ